jgi:hypothetical protein
MLSKAALPGDTLVKAGSNNPLVSVHAARNADGGMSVVLLNQDPANEYTVKLNYDGWTPSGATPTVHTFASRRHLHQHLEAGHRDLAADPGVLDRDAEAQARRRPTRLAPP